MCAASNRKTLPRKFYDRRPVEVAQDLLNKLIVVDDASGRIVEVEAYEGAVDPASHAFRGLTPRTTVMFGPPGRLYVYFSYGVHWCANVVTSPEGVAGAVLLRSIVPVDGIETMRERRENRRDSELANGPGKLCQALGISRTDNGIDVTRGRVRIVDDGMAPPIVPVVTPRIGITRGTELPWRFMVQP